MDDDLPPGAALVGFDHPPRDAPGAGGARRPVLRSARAWSTSRSRARCWAPRSPPPSTAAVASFAWLGLAAGIGFAIFLAMSTASPASPTAATRWFRAWRSTSWSPGSARRRRGLVRPGRPHAALGRRCPLHADHPAVRRGAALRPVLGPIYGELISGHNILVYATAAAVPVVAWILYRTRFGLRLRAVGENPSAVDTAGISVTAMRYQALIVTGALCGVAGAYLSTGHGASFLRDMTAGKGYLALAALIFGKWRPVPALLACLLFAFTDAVQIRLQGVPCRCSARCRPRRSRRCPTSRPCSCWPASWPRHRPQGDRRPLRQGALSPWALRFLVHPCRS